MPITRTPIINDDGTCTTGTLIDNAWKQEFYDQIDAANRWDLLKSGAGSNTAAGAANLDAVSIPALNGFDSLVAIYWLYSSAQPTQPCQLYANASLFGNISPVLSTENQGLGRVTLRQGHAPTVGIMAAELPLMTTARYDLATLVGLGTPWTSPWQLALNTGGTAAGGTLYWSWSVYRVRG